MIWTVGTKMKREIISLGKILPELFLLSKIQVKLFSERTYFAFFNIQECSNYDDTLGCFSVQVMQCLVFDLPKREKRGNEKGL